MGIYYSDEIRGTGGRRSIDSRTVVTDQPDELRALHAELVRRLGRGRVSIRTPGGGVRGHLTKSRPHVLVREEDLQAVRDLGGVKIPARYLEFVVYQLKRRMHEQFVGADRVSSEASKYFEIKIRSKVIELLESGDWIESPERIEDQGMSVALQKLNAAIEKIDLGRRSDLKFSSFQEENLRPRYSSKQKLYPRITNPSLREWIDGDEAERVEILRSRPWILRQLEDEDVLIPPEIKHLAFQ